MHLGKYLLPGQPKPFLLVMTHLLDIDWANETIGGAAVNMLVWQVRGHNVNAYRCTYSAVGDQTTLLNLVKREVIECEFLVRTVP